MGPSKGFGFTVTESEDEVLQKFGAVAGVGWPVIIYGPGTDQLILMEPVLVIGPAIKPVFGTIDQFDKLEPTAV